MESNSKGGYFCAPAAEWLPKVWLSKDVIMCSLLTVEGATLVQPDIRHINGLEKEIVASSKLAGRRMQLDVCFDADDVFFPKVDGPEIGAVLVHWGNVPLFVCDHANGMPIAPNGGDIWVTWQDYPPFIAALPYAKALS